MLVGALVPCKRLHTIVDAHNLGVPSYLSSALAVGHVKDIMRGVTSVEKIVSGKWCWTVCLFPVDFSMIMKVEASA